ncbi:MAG TPA: hypothetical protein VNM87_10555 [Candidatus Udaeobacter sp.]|nr:hypothetical protein [Candidatus Udaeobacter sp.]
MTNPSIEHPAVGAPGRLEVLPGWRALGQRQPLAVLLIGALLVRAPLAFIAGYKGDQTYWEILARNAITAGWPHVYALTAREPWLGIYPPLYHAMLAIVGHVYQTIFSPAFQVPSPSLNVLVKLVPVGGDLLIGALIWRVVRRIAGLQAAWMAAGAFLFNPAIIYCSSYWGMFGDPAYALGALAAVAAMCAGRVPMAWVAIAIAIMIKPQAAVFGPLLAWATLRGTSPRQWLGAVAAGGLTLGAILLPFVLAGTLGEMIQSLSKTVGLFPVLSANAHNVWFLWSHGKSWASDAVPILGPFSARTIGLTAFALAYGLALWALGKPPFRARLFPTAAYVGMAFFMLATEMHENYIYPTVMFLALASWESRFRRSLCGLVSMCALANMALHDPLFKLGHWLGHHRMMDLRLLNSALLVLVFAQWTYQLAAERLAPSEAQSGGKAAT